MTKQTYTSGQVLTAAQMTTLQTNDYNQTVSAKTASYTLVAADAGTTITMSNASATSVTVNTSLFAAGDTLRVTNIGAGVCTIAAGTATVSTSGVLTLAQWASGILYFTSTGVAIFFGSASASASGGMTLISTTTLSGASITLSSIPQTYKNLFMVVRLPLVGSDAWELKMSFNGDTTANRHATALTTNPSNATFNMTGAQLTQENGMDNAVTQGTVMVTFPDYTNTSTWKMANAVSFTNNATTTANYNYANYGLGYNQVDAITSLQIRAGAGNLTSGTVLLYGVN